MADPNWASVRLLVPFAPQEGATSFTDLARQRLFSQINGDSQPVTATTSSPFVSPTTSARFTSAGGLSLPSHADWNLGTGDFTIEGFYQSVTILALAGGLFCGSWVAATGGRGWEFFRQSNTRQIGFRWSTTGTDEPAALIGSAGSAWGSGWHHLCAMRASGVLYLFVNGVLVGSTAVASIFANNRDLTFGRRLAGTSSTYNQGGMSDWRISSIARYATTGFTPPTAPFEGDGTNPARLTQGVSLMGTGQGVGMGRISQAVALILQAPVVPSHLTQAVALVSEPGIRPARITQAPALVLVQAESCSTTRAQIWTIRRRDGVVFSFTSHDQPIRRFGRTYTPCRSLDPSASENASTLGSVGNIELTGIIDDASISEADLYGGKFDDAFVTVDLVDWSDRAADAIRIASGWTGELSQGDEGFSMEVLGAGSRLDQQALVQMIAPGCRWIFGSPQCGKDKEALKMTGTVTTAKSRGALVAVLSNDGAGRQWENGTVRFTSGANAGQSVEIKTVDFGTGAVVLWAAPAFIPAPGDAFDMLPGCDLAKTGGCTLYANVINFGGFSDVPGQDSLLETPDAKF
ncbi:MAG: DUF2163 domain-containing protein [Brevundimonas sp.]